MIQVGETRNDTAGSSFQPRLYVVGLGVHEDPASVKQPIAIVKGRFGNSS